MKRSRTGGFRAVQKSGAREVCSPPNRHAHGVLRNCPLNVCAVTRRRFPVDASPTRQPLQPEATGAVMEVTKWLRAKAVHNADEFMSAIVAKRLVEHLGRLRHHEETADCRRERDFWY
jgi:hypothetical protein